MGFYKYIFGGYGTESERDNPAAAVMEKFAIEMSPFEAGVSRGCRLFLNSQIEFCCSLRGALIQMHICTTVLQKSPLATTSTKPSSMDLHGSNYTWDKMELQFIE